MRCEETQELITALVDHELYDPELSLLESHLKNCPKCQLALAQEQTLKREARAASLNLRAPAELRERILADRRIFPEKAGSIRGRTVHVWPAKYILRPVFALALVLILALPTLYLLNQRSESISLAAVETYGGILRGDPPMIRAKSTEEMKEALARAVGGSFSPMGYDLSMMNLEPVAGAVREIEGRKILVTLYRGQGPSLICYTFLGTEADVPPNAATFFDPEKKIHLYAFSRGSINALLHREGNVICILVSEMPMQDLLALVKSTARPS